MENQRVQYVQILKRHFDPSFAMLTKLVEYCPDSLWCEPPGKAPFWQHVYHTAYFVDFWLREDYSGAEFRSMQFAKDVQFELGVQSPEVLTQDELTAYLQSIRAKLERLFGTLTDETLLSPLVPQRDSALTYADAILMQIRHVQYHVGHCNRILRQYGVKTVGWLGYHEE